LIGLADTITEVHEVRHAYQGNASSPGVASSSAQNKGVRIKRTPKVAENVFRLEDMASVAKGY
jgi:hypothetical protein